jgi:hypothetical protein
MLVRNEMADSSELVNTILARTREGKLTWAELSVSSFLTRVEQIMIVIDRPRSDRPPSIRITDESGKVLELIEGPIFAGGGLVGTVELLSELYELARRQALRVDETLSDLKRRLDKL